MIIHAAKCLHCDHHWILNYPAPYTPKACPECKRRKYVGKRQTGDKRKRGEGIPVVVTQEFEIDW